MSEEVLVAAASSGQERLWFLDQFLETGPAYNVCQAFRLSGRLDEDILRRSLDLVVARHESLRTALRMIGGELKQVIFPAMRAPLRIVDFTDTGARLSDRLRAALGEEARTPFKLREAPLFRATLFRVAARE